MRLSCIVCYEIFSPSDNVHAASCGHILHYHCWTAWLGRHPNCPECREPVQAAQLRRLFFTSDPEEWDYATLSSKYNTLKYDFDCKTKEVQTANATVEKQKKDIEALRSQVKQWKRKVVELQKSKNEVKELVPNAPAPSMLVLPPSSFISAGFNVNPLSYPAPGAYTGCGTALADSWRRSYGVTFQHTVSNLSLLQDGQTSSSPAYLIRNLPWKIRIMPRRKTDTNCIRSNDDSNRWLGFFLQCNGDDTLTEWSCYATADLRILPQREGVPVFERKIHHLYYHDESDWGFRHFVQLNDLLNPAKGYIKDDTVVVEVRVDADVPIGVVSAQRPVSCALGQ